MELSVIDQERIRHQFDYICKMVMRGERFTYIKQILKRSEKEIPFSDVPEIELNSFYTTDKYPVENKHYSVMGYTIEVKDEKLVAAIDELTPMKRAVVLLHFFMGMNCTAIAKLIGRDCSTISHHKRSALVLMKKSMEERKRPQ